MGDSVGAIPVLAHMLKLHEFWQLSFIKSAN